MNMQLLARPKRHPDPSIEEIILAAPPATTDFRVDTPDKRHHGQPGNFWTLSPVSTAGPRSQRSTRPASIPGSNAPTRKTPNQLIT